jgi:predicted NAD/FAD-binding protein
VSGLTAAYLLRWQYDVTLYEADGRLGGHAHTHQVRDRAGSTLAVDSGFIVHNDRTYPYLRRLFSELGVATRPTEMSMSIRDERTGLEYAGGRGLKGIFGQPRRVVDPRLLSVLAQVRRFHTRASRFLAETGDDDLTSFGDFLADEGFSADFRDLYAVPVVSCVWSTGTHTALEYPARYLFRFLEHHGMLSVTGSPRWYTVLGGSRSYVEAIRDRLEDVLTRRRVTSVLREPEGVLVVDDSGSSRRFDRVVVATHADQALDLLGDPSPEEKEVLGAFRYTRNETVLHTDDTLLPRARQTRASWNYLTRPAYDGDAPPVVTYWMNRLQGLDSPEQYLVTLNARHRVHPDKVLAAMDYDHPVYDAPAVAAQGRLASLTTPQTAFAGAYHGWGFHEDGCRSGVEAARAFGVIW